MPDYKPSFPHWSPTDLSETVPNLDKHGIDILKVRCPFFAFKTINSPRSAGLPHLQHRNTYFRYALVRDTSARMLTIIFAAKRALIHPYFAGYVPEPRPQ